MKSSENTIKIKETDYIYSYDLGKGDTSTFMKYYIDRQGKLNIVEFKPL